jgi:hypothetical protein
VWVFGSKARPATRGNPRAPTDVAAPVAVSIVTSVPGVWFDPYSVSVPGSKARPRTSKKPSAPTSVAEPVVVSRV